MCEVEFFHHPSFDSEWKDLSERFPFAEQGLDGMKNLLTQQFHPRQPQIVITKKLLHQVPHTGELDMWKVTVFFNPLRKNQSPRVYFWKDNHKIHFLCFDSHLTNYKDEKLRSMAMERVKHFKASQS